MRLSTEERNVVKGVLWTCFLAAAGPGKEAAGRLHAGRFNTQARTACLCCCRSVLFGRESDTTLHAVPRDSWVPFWSICVLGHRPST